VRLLPFRFVPGFIAPQHEGQVDETYFGLQEYSTVIPSRDGRADHAMAGESTLTLFLVAGAILTGCASEPPQQRPALTSRPIPSTLEGRQRECEQIRYDLADVESRASVASQAITNPSMRLYAIAELRQQRAELESRAAQLSCAAAFSSVVREPSTRPPQPPPSRLSFDECFARCKDLTERTNEQCFDTCRE